MQGMHNSSSTCLPLSVTFILFWLFYPVFAGAAILGSVSGWFPINETFDTELFLGKRIVFRALDVAWTTTDATLKTVEDELNAIVSVNAIPVINWNPLLSDTYRDTLQAIEDGLHDDIIDTFFTLLNKTVQNTYCVVFFGTTCNSNGVYWSEDPELYIRVYKKLHIKGKTTGVADRIIWGWNIDITKFKAIEGNLYALNTTNLVHTPSEYFPGESYVNWIALQIINDDIHNWVDPEEPIRVGMGVASSLAPGKPVMLIGGTSSMVDNGRGEMVNSTTAKSTWLEEFVEAAYTHMDRTEGSAAMIKAIMLYNRESSLDTGFYNSVYGDVVTSISNNGVELFSYSVLETLFSDQIIAEPGSEPYIDEVSPIVAFGAICGPGERGQASSGTCAPCEAGTYSNKTGASECDLCPVGFYNEDVGQVECVPCPANKTTVHSGARLEEYCECAPGFVLRDANNTDAGCIQCQRNSYSKGGTSTCQQCPSGNRWPTGKSGVGCFCKRGTWDHKTEQCTTITSGFSASTSVTISISVGLILMLTAIFVN